MNIFVIEVDISNNAMCHVSDPCASSPQPLDQTVIRWMVEIELSCASLHVVRVSEKSISVM